MNSIFQRGDFLFVQNKEISVYFRAIANSADQEFAATTTEVIDLTPSEVIDLTVDLESTFAERLAQSCEDDMEMILNAQVTKLETYAEVADILYQKERIQMLSTELVHDKLDILNIAGDDLEKIQKTPFDALLDFLAESD